MKHFNPNLSESVQWWAIKAIKSLTRNETEIKERILSTEARLQKWPRTDWKNFTDV
jgi:hypothetical protein